MAIVSSDGEYLCTWEVTAADFDDCEAIWPTTTSEAPGCCVGLTAKASEMRNEKETNKMHVRSDKCEWYSAELVECAWPTTTEEP